MKEMDNIVIQPLIGFGEIKLGERLLPNNKFLGKADDGCTMGDDFEIQYYWNSLLTIQTRKGIIDAIGIRNGEQLQVHVIMYGLNVFTTKAEELVKAVKIFSKTKFIEDDPEIPYSYKFPELELTFWREYLPFEVEEKEQYEVFEYVGICAHC